MPWLARSAARRQSAGAIARERFARPTRRRPDPRGSNSAPSKLDSTRIDTPSSAFLSSPTVLAIAAIALLSCGSLVGMVALRGAIDLRRMRPPTFSPVWSILFAPNTTADISPLPAADISPRGRNSQPSPHWRLPKSRRSRPPKLSRTQPLMSLGGSQPPIFSKRDSPISRQSRTPIFSRLDLCYSRHSRTPFSHHARPPMSSRTRPPILLAAREQPDR